jgi:diguanylate cyclase (GGDEF)-like protein
MSKQLSQTGTRTFLAGKIISNYGQSTIDCVVRRISDDGATVEAENSLGIPELFHLAIAGEGNPRPCKRVWQSDKQLGLAFEDGHSPAKAAAGALPSEHRSSLMRGPMLSLRAAFDEIEIGIVLLDADMRAQFINRAFRKMWDVPDAMACRNPSFVELMYHGRDSNAYQVPAAELDAYIAERVRLVRAGAMAPVNLRRSNGEVLLVQCAVLPNGGRMLSYTSVTEIARRSDELEALRNALEHVDEGIVLLDADLNVQFLNRKMRKFWDLTPEQAASKPAYADLVARAARAYHHASTTFDLKAFVAKRVAAVRDPDAASPALRTADGRHIRVHCLKLENDGRLLTYHDISDLVRNAEQLEKLATTDAMTGLYNRGHFLSLAKTEWSRFQRYCRPLSVLMIDIDHFKTVNDRYGHAVGDEAIISVANACRKGKRDPDIVGRLGGEEFAILLPETDLSQARVVAERLVKNVAGHGLMAHRVHFHVTVSIGFAAATLSMAGFEALLHAADQALYQAKSTGRNCAVAWSPPIAPKLAAE